MNIFARAYAAFTSAIGGAATSALNWLGLQPLQKVAYLNLGGVIVTQDTALNVSTAWACIELIAKSIASCRWKIYAPVPGTKRRRLLDADDRAWILNTRPNPEMSAVSFWEALLFQALAWGNGYAEIVYSPSGRFRELWLLDTSRMMVRRNTQTGAIEYHYTNEDGRLVVLGPGQVYHLRGPSLDGLMGENVIARAIQTIALALSMQRSGLQYYERNAQLGGVLEYPGKLGPAKVQELQDQYAKKHQGMRNAHAPLILEGGMKFHQTSATPKDSNTVEEKKFSVEEICRWFGVPPHKVQSMAAASTYGSIEHSSIEFVRDALRPWVVRLTQEADFKLFGGYRGPVRQTEIDTRPLTMGDMQSRATAFGTMLQNGQINRNEARELDGMDDMGPEGDVYTVQVNLTTLKKLLAAAEEDDEAVVEEDGNEPDPTAPRPSNPPPNEDDDAQPATE